MAPMAECKSVEKRQAEDTPSMNFSGLFSDKRQQQSLVLSGPSSRQEMPELGDLFKPAEGERQEPNLILGGSSGAHQARDINEQTDRFMETMQEAAKKFNAKRELERAARAEAGNHHVVTCVYCDNRCVAKAKASGYDDSKEYFDMVIGEMNRIIKGLDEGMDFELTFVMLPYTITEMSWFFDYSATTSEQLLTAINNKFWKDSGLYSMAQTQGCDIDFLVADGSDPAWNYMGSIAGIANMFQLCQAAYSTVLMNPNPISLAKLMTHEYGHMIGLYHDGALNVAFTSMKSPTDYFAPGQMMAGCAAEYDDADAACNAGSVGCPSGKCIMAATVDGTDWSDCSKAYYSMFNCLVDTMPMYYNDACTKLAD